MWRGRDTTYPGTFVMYDAPAHGGPAGICMELSQLSQDDVALMLPCPLEASGDFLSTWSPQLWEGWRPETSS